MIPARLSTLPRRLKSRPDFVWPKNSPCRRVGLRQVTDPWQAFQIRPPNTSPKLKVSWSSRRVARLPIVKCVEEASSRRCALATEEQDENQSLRISVSSRDH
jgi:hypothetical protein